MTWYKILKIIIEVLSFGLLTYEKVENKQKENTERNTDPKTDPKDN